MSEILRRSEGARLIQLPSGSMPTTSECACCDIIRMSWRRYFSGIQSFGSMLSPEAIRASKAATLAGSSAGEAGRECVILLRSDGDGPFCAGASFDELISIGSREQGQEFFSGFARVILAMIRAPKFVIVRVHGRTAGGGVGIAAAADYTFAVRKASAK